MDVMFLKLLPLFSDRQIQRNKPMNINLTEVNPQDEIMIRTQESEYRFKVSDSRFCRGLLTGVLLGQRHRDSFLAGVIFPEAERISDSKRLETGTRAIFYLDGKRGVYRLITSVITELTIAGNSTNNRNNKRPVFAFRSMVAFMLAISVCIIPPIP
jgi:hypothetical protein